MCLRFCVFGLLFADTSYKVFIIMLVMIVLIRALIFVWSSYSAYNYSITKTLKAKTSKTKTSKISTNISLSFKSPYFRKNGRAAWSKRNINTSWHVHTYFRCPSKWRRSWWTPSQSRGFRLIFTSYLFAKHKKIRAKNKTTVLLKISTKI